MSELSELNCIWNPWYLQIAANSVKWRQQVSTVVLIGWKIFYFSLSSGSVGAWKNPFVQIMSRVDWKEERVRGGRGLCNDFGFSCLPISTNFLEVFFSRCKNTLTIIGMRECKVQTFYEELGTRRRLDPGKRFVYRDMSRSDIVLMAMEQFLLTRPPSIAE